MVLRGLANFGSVGVDVAMALAFLIGAMAQHHRNPKRGWELEEGGLVGKSRVQPLVIWMVAGVGGQEYPAFGSKLSWTTNEGHGADDFTLKKFIPYSTIQRNGKWLVEIHEYTHKQYYDTDGIFGFRS